TASLDRTARVWDAETGRPVGPPLRHADRLTGAAFSPDGRRVLTLSWDDTGRVWDAASGTPLTPPLRHGSPVMCGAFSPDGRLDPDALRGPTAVRPGGRQLAVVREPERGPGPQRWEVVVYDVATGRPASAPASFPSRVLCVGFDAQGRCQAVTARQAGPRGPK